MKEAYYFSHDANARKDPKIMKLIMAHGMEGYGIYWSLIEMLRESGDYMLSLCDCNAIAYDLHCEESKVLSIVNDYSLFEVTKDKLFWSRSLVERMKKWAEKSKIARENALKRWNVCNSNATAMQTDAKKRKEKKRKESNAPKAAKFIKPTIQAIKDYCLERNNGIDPQRFYDSNEGKGWVVGTTKSPMKDWKAVIRTWEGNNTKKETQYEHSL